MTRTFTAEELSERTGVSPERIRWLTTIGLIQRRDPERFTPGDGFRARMIDALLQAGVNAEQIEMAVRVGSLNLSHVDRYILMDPGQLSKRTAAQFMADFMPRGAMLPSIYKVLGIPEPAPDSHLPEAEEGIVRGFMEAWRLAPDDESLTRAARMIAEGTRLVVAGWTDLFDEQVSGPVRERLLRGELKEFPPDVSHAVAEIMHLIPRLFEWLTDRYVQQVVVAGIVENLEEYLASRGLVPIPPPGPPPAVVFVDVSGFTRITEQRGDESAARTGEVLRERAEAVAEAEEGRVVKLLGDGAMLSFRDPARAVRAATRLVRDLRAALDLPAHAGVHAGPVIQRDRDLFGRTVNLASRIAGQAGPDEVVVSAEVAALVGSHGTAFEEIGKATLKGFEEPVRLFRLQPARGG